MLSYIWIRLLGALESKLAKEMIIPVMDGFEKDTVRKLSTTVKSFDVMRSAITMDNCTIANTENIIGEVFYADSQHSIFTQVVDLVSWLRQLSDASRQGHSLTPYKTTLLSLSDDLDSMIIHEEIVTMNMLD
jgi:hypothetical protein